MCGVCRGASSPNTLLNVLLHTINVSRSPLYNVYRAVFTMLTRSCMRPSALGKVSVRYARARQPVLARAQFKLSVLASPQVTVVPTKPAIEQGSVSWVAAPLAFIVLAGALVGWKKVKSGSVSGLVERGYLSSSRSKADPFYKDVMKDVNTVAIEQLSEAQILAARARRSKERANHKLSLDDVELPENHPFAVRRKLSKDEEQLIAARLNARRGMPVAGPEPALSELESASEGVELARRRQLPPKDVPTTRAQRRPGVSS